MSRSPALRRPGRRAIVAGAQMTMPMGTPPPTQAPITPAEQSFYDQASTDAAEALSESRRRR